MLMVEVYLSSNLSLGDLLCTEGLATRPSLVDVQLYRTPDGHSEPSDDDQPSYALPASCDDLPQRQVVVVAMTALVLLLNETKMKSVF